MKKKLIQKLSKSARMSLPVNYSFVFYCEEKDIEKTPSKYVYCEKYGTNKYLAEPFYKPVSTTFPNIAG